MEWLVLDSKEQDLIFVMPAVNGSEGVCRAVDVPGRQRKPTVVCAHGFGRKEHHHGTRNLLQAVTEAGNRSGSRLLETSNGTPVS